MVDSKEAGGTMGAGIQWGDGSCGNGGAGSAGKSVGGDDVNANGNVSGSTTTAKGKTKCGCCGWKKGDADRSGNTGDHGDNNGAEEAEVFLVLDAESARIPPPTSPPAISMAVLVTGRYGDEEDVDMIDVDVYGEFYYVAYLDIEGGGGGVTRSATALEARKVASDGNGSEEKDELSQFRLALRHVVSSRSGGDGARLLQIHL